MQCHSSVLCWITKINNSTDFCWTEKATLLLIEEYRLRRQAFRNPKVKKKELWAEVCATFKCHDLHVSSDQLDKKFRNLKQTFMRIRDLQNVKTKSGGGPVSWRYYNQFVEIFYGDVCSTPATSPIDSIPKAKTQRPSSIPAPTLPMPMSSPSLPIEPTPGPSREEEEEEPAEEPPQTPSKKRGNKSTGRKGLMAFRAELVRAEVQRLAALNAIKEAQDEGNRILKEFVEVQKKKCNLLEKHFEKK